MTSLLLGFVSLLFIILGFYFMTIQDMHKCPYCNRRFETNRGKLIHIARKHD